MTPPPVNETYLQPGEVRFGGQGMLIRTLLGSCVAVTIWHPRLRIGGMCHYMLPARSVPRTGALDGRYADEAMELLLHEIAAAGTPPGEYQLKLFGGGNMFPGIAPLSRAGNVSGKNVEAGRELARRHGFALGSEHLGGVGHRNIVFDLGSGEVRVRHHLPAKDACAGCDGRTECVTA